MSRSTLLRRFYSNVKKSEVSGSLRQAIRCQHAAHTASITPPVCPPYISKKRFFASTAEAALPPQELENDNTARNKPSLEESKNAILTTSLDHVHEKGWTEDAIASATLSLRLPPTLMGLIPNRPHDLISFFMRQSNDKLQYDINQHLKPRWIQEQTSVAQRIEDMLQVRLQFIIPFVRSKRWHEAMAIGVSTPENAMATAAILDKMVSIVINAALEGTGNSVVTFGGVAEKAAITTVYASTELHMLADESVNYEDTWTFLKERVAELERVAMVTAGGVGGAGHSTMSSSDALIAASAVASSLGGAVLSLASPAASVAASTVAPQLMLFMQQVRPPNSAPFSQAPTVGQAAPGTQPDDYYDEEEKKKVDKILDSLPPFEEDMKR